MKARYLEDLSENMGPETDKINFQNSKKRENHWTLLFVGKNGRLISIRNFKGLAIGCISTFIISIIASIILLFFHINNISEKKHLLNSLGTCRQELISLKNEKDLLAVRLVHAESKTGKIFDKKNEKQKVKSIAKRALDKKNSEPVDSKKKVRSGEKQPKKNLKPVAAEKNTSPGKSDKIAIDNFVFLYNPGGNTLKIKFKIKNRGLKSKPVTGYYFVLLKGDKIESANWMSLPNSLLVSGMPSEIKNGRYFSISNYKTIKFSLKNQNVSEEFNTAVLLIFNKEGNLLFSKEFPVKIKKKKIEGLITKKSTSSNMPLNSNPEKSKREEMSKVKSQSYTSSEENSTDVNY